MPKRAGPSQAPRSLPIRGLSTTADLQGGVHAYAGLGGLPESHLGGGLYIARTSAEVVLLDQVPPVVQDLALTLGLNWVQVNQDGFGSPETRYLSSRPSSPAALGPTSTPAPGAD